jgi:hypothetical protein
VQRLIENERRFESIDHVPPRPKAGPARRAVRPKKPRNRRLVDELLLDLFPEED